MIVQGYEPKVTPRLQQGTRHVFVGAEGSKGTRGDWVAGLRRRLGRREKGTSKGAAPTLIHQGGPPPTLLFFPCPVVGDASSCCPPFRSAAAAASAASFLLRVMTPDPRLTGRRRVRGDRRDRVEAEATEAEAEAEEDVEAAVPEAAVLVAEAEEDEEAAVLEAGGDASACRAGRVPACT